MLVFPALLIFILIYESHHLPAFLAKLSMPIHSACLQLSPSILYQPVFNAFLCGAPFPHASTFDDLKATGLLHLVVVSGAHLLIVEQFLLYFLAKRPSLKKVIFPALIFYMLAARAAPPIMRALLSFAFKSLQKKFSLRWSALQINAISGVLGLVLFQNDRQRSSLLLSWTCALAMAISQLNSNPADQKKSKIFIWTATLRTCIYVYVLLFPLLLPLSPPHPFSIACNLIMAPLISGLFFPIILLGAAFKFLTLHLGSLRFESIFELIDFIWCQFATILHWAAHWLPSPLEPKSLARQWLYFYVLTLNVFFLVFEVHFKRQKMKRILL